MERKAQTGDIIFFAKSNLGDLTINFNDTIKFPNEEYEGGQRNYDKFTGIYTAPINGIYSFSVFIGGRIYRPKNEEQDFIIMAMISSGFITPQVKIKTPTYKNYFNVSLNFNSILNQGDTVKIYVNSLGRSIGDYIIGDRGNGCFFSGTLINKT